MWNDQEHCPEPLGPAKSGPCVSGPLLQNNLIGTLSSLKDVL